MLRLITLPIRVPYKVGRRAGPGRVLVYGLGVVTGLLLAQEPGRDLRERLRQQWQERAGGPGGPAEPGGDEVERRVVVERHVVEDTRTE